MTHDIRIHRRHRITTTSHSTQKERDTMSTTRPRQLLRRITAALGVGLFAAVGVAGPALAAEGNLDASADVTLTVHKYVQPDSGTLGDNAGHEIVDPVGTPLDGVVFSVQEVTSIDLSTNAGWEAVNGLTADKVLASVAANDGAYTLGTAVDTAKTTTDANGEFTLADPDVEVGVYLVQETDPGSNEIAAPAVPFLVTLPQPDGAGVFNYDVHVYPKNALNAITKTADDSAAHQLGDTVTWTIESAVPTLPDGTTYTDYAVGDALDARLGFGSATVSLVDGTATPLVKDTDYTLTAPAVGSSGEVTVEFLPDGLAKLNAASPAAQVKLVLGTTVLDLGDGTITNDATVWVNTPANDRTPENGTTSEGADTEWGAVSIVKHAEGDNAKLLAGAEFSVYAVDPTSQGAQPIITGLTTDDTGKALTVLRAGEDDAAVTYWLVETKAPAGYVVGSKPIEVEVTAGAVADATVATIANAQVPAFMLPRTGGSGTAIFLTAGAATIVVALGTLTLVAGRRRAAAQHAA